jgi:hypothetical protein
LIEQHLTDSRRGKNTQFPFADPPERDGNPLLAESHLTRRLFGAMVWRIESLPLPAG